MVSSQRFTMLSSATVLARFANLKQQYKPKRSNPRLLLLLYPFILHSTAPQYNTIDESGLSRKSVCALSITCSNILRLYSTLIVHLYLINVFLLCPLSRKGPNARHTRTTVVLRFVHKSQATFFSHVKLATKDFSP